MREVAVVTLAAAARHHRIFDDLPGALALGGREILAHHRGILRMQMHAHLARRDGQRRDGLADDADDLRGIGLELAPHDLARERHGQGRGARAPPRRRAPRRASQGRRTCPSSRSTCAPPRPVRPCGLRRAPERKPPCTLPPAGRRARSRSPWTAAALAPLPTSGAVQSSTFAEPGLETKLDKFAGALAAQADGSLLGEALRDRRRSLSAQPPHRRASPDRALPCRP